VSRPFPSVSPGIAVPGDCVDPELPLPSRAVAAARQARGIPLSIKLIVATSIVVAAAVGTATLFAQRAIGEVARSQIAARRHSGERAITRASELVVQAVATALALPLANHAYNDVKVVLEAAIADDRSSGDNRVQWLVVQDDAGAVVERTAAMPDRVELDRLQHVLAGGDRNHAGVAHARTGAGWVYGADIKLGATVVGSLQIGVSTAGLDRELGAAIAEAERVALGSRKRALLVSLVVLAVGSAIAALHGVRLARPIKALTLQAERIAAGDLDSRVREDRRDELGVLAHAFNVMSDEIRRLLVEQARKASLEKELSLARQVQQAMLPPETLDHHGALKVVGTCMPASTCGGDWWTYRKLANGRMLLVIGDATGHGMHSAMIAATARGAVEALSGIDERLLTPEQVLRAIDSAIRQVGEHNVLMTAFAAVLDSTTGILHYANAGQNFPYVIGLGQARVLGPASIIAASGNPLGDRHIPVEIRRGSQQLRPGDLFVCFTDGLVERANPAGKLFGDRRLRSALIGESLADGPALVALRDRIVQALDRHAEGTIAQDDITLVLCQFDPHRAEAPVRDAGRGAA
jgi:serine phosphatase RsbU (regulator of sigma subunit)